MIINLFCDCLIIIKVLITVSVLLSLFQISLLNFKLSAAAL